MTDAADEIATLTRLGFESLRRGDTHTARDCFGRATAARTAGADAWFGLSIAHRRLGLAEAERAALDQALELDAKHVPALIAKGDLYSQTGDGRAAVAFYRAAIKLGRAQGLNSGEWRAEFKRIDALCQQSAQDMETHLTAELVKAGFGSPGSERFAHALDLLLERRQVYFQRPKLFYFPELPQIQFYDSESFPWVRELEASAPAIRAELHALLDSEEDFVPYMQAETDRPAFDTNGLLNDRSWSAFHLLRNGKEVEGNASRCPITIEALQRVPLCRIKGRTPTALFSLLRSGTHIPPHHGFLNTRLICHLPLIVPSDCALRVGNDTRCWREGKLFIFDDTIEHEAWNRSPDLRVVLLFDIWRPELSEFERSLVAAMLECIDDFGGARREWTQ